MTDKQFEGLFNKAKELMARTLDPVHDWAHIERVLVNLEKIKIALPLEKTRDLDDKILKLAVAWHDMSYIKYRATLAQYLLESWRTKKIIHHYFIQADLDKEETDLINDIILHHDWVEIFILKWLVLNKKRSLYHQIVQDADTLDSYSHERVSQAEKNRSHSLFKRAVMGVLKPLFFNFLIKRKSLIYNLPETIEKIESQT